MLRRTTELSWLGLSLLVVATGCRDERRSSNPGVVLIDVGAVDASASDGGALPDVSSSVDATPFDAGSETPDARAFDAGPPPFDAGPEPSSDAGAPFDAGFDGGRGTSTTGAIDLSSGLDRSLEGNTETTGLTWQRPNITCSYLSSNREVAYDTHVLRNSTGAALNVLINTETSFDSYLHAYLGTTLPADGLDCLEADDDGGAGSDAMLELEIASGQSVLVVVGGYSDSDSGAYTLRVEAD